MSKSLVATPDPDNSIGLPVRGSRHLARLQDRAEMDTYRHGLEAAMKAEFDRQDGQAVSDAIRSSLDEELDLLEWGLHRAEGSTAKIELVARKVNMLSQLNDRRLTRRFSR
jgi:hypothetical protein